MTKKLGHLLFCQEIGQHFGFRRTFQSEHPSLRNLGRGQGIQKNTQVSDGSCFGFGNVEGVAVETPSAGLRVFLGDVLKCQLHSSLQVFAAFS